MIAAIAKIPLAKLTNCEGSLQIERIVRIANSGPIIWAAVFVRSKYEKFQALFPLQTLNVIITHILSINSLPSESCQAIKTFMFF